MDLNRKIPIQSYEDHVLGVDLLANANAKSVAKYAVKDGDLLCETVKHAARFHDLGKLDVQNQKVLNSERKTKRLPIQHTDAGTSYLLNKVENPFGAVLIRSHHIGLPNFVEEKNRLPKSILRDDSIREHTDKTLAQLIDDHYKCINLQESRFSDSRLNLNPPVFYRIALSCLVDADHTDTSMHYRNCKENECIGLNPRKRLDLLNNYVEKLKNNNSSSNLRTSVYEDCKNFSTDSNISSCDSPTGTGKTTAIMAHLLKQSINRELRRIIVVLPFTNIIAQSVEVYRNTLVFPEENPQEVVAELHHCADFQNADIRHLTALWKAPIIVTTAVSFFETLASNKPSTLRKLHNLPGSAIFIDESHAALPTKLLPLAWRWIKIYAEEWGCYWVLASGSLNKFWKVNYIDPKKPEIPEIIPNETRKKLNEYELSRVAFRHNCERLDISSVIDFVIRLPGPRLLILNTVQSAAILASAFYERFDRKSVEHLSSALIPNDRKATLLRVKRRLSNKNDVDWTLVATSCVQAGVDLSFRSGIMELCSLMSLLQIGGRVNRSGYWNSSEVWTIKLNHNNGLLRRHPSMNNSIEVLKRYILDGIEITSNLCTEAFENEIKLSGNFYEDLVKNEENMNFLKVEKDFNVINSNTRIVIVNDELSEMVKNNGSVNWRDIQSNSVRIYNHILEEHSVPKIKGELYKWNLGYDKFIGYMSGHLGEIINRETQ
jgi:CRISPR-associated endonuclease/helicase Cas3